MHFKKLHFLLHPLFPGLLVIFVFIIAGCSTLQKQVKPGWSTREIAPGVQLSHQYFHSLFHAPENINMLDVDLNDTAITLKIAYNDSLLEPVSQFGKAGNAIAAVNGNFFNTHIGGSVCFLKVDGRVVNRTHDELDGTLFLPWLDTAAIAISGNKVAILIKPAGIILTAYRDTFPTIISAGPLLVWKNKVVSMQAHGFNDKRYSRTGIAITKSKHLLIVAVDGNAKESAGFTNPEFAKFFKALKCVTALNLDGGGSTTMWVSGEPGNGVVSHPTDNKKYDHLGERKVANAILIGRR